MGKFPLEICSLYNTNKFIVGGFISIKMNAKELKQRYEALEQKVGVEVFKKSKLKLKEKKTK